MSDPLTDAVTVFREAIIPKFSCSSSETSESEGICADFASRDRQSEISTDDDLWTDRISSRYPMIQNINQSVDLGEYLLFERRAYSVPRSPMNISMLNSSLLNSSYNSPRSSKIPVSSRSMSQSFSVSASMVMTPKRMTRATQSLTEAMNGSREQLCQPFVDIKSEARLSVARSRARSLQKQKLDDRWLLEPGDMTRSLSASYCNPSPSRRVLSRPRICRTAEEIHAERSTMWLSKLRSDIETFVDEKGRLTPDSDEEISVKKIEVAKEVPKRKWKKTNQFGGRPPLTMEKLIRWCRAVKSFCPLCRGHNRLSRLSRRSTGKHLSCSKIEKTGVIRRNQCICKRNDPTSSREIRSPHSDCIYSYKWAVFFAALAFLFRLILIFF